jgi:hypothetical protein
MHRVHLNYSTPSPVDFVGDRFFSYHVKTFFSVLSFVWCVILNGDHRHNSSLTKLYIIIPLSRISFPVEKFVALEFVLCRLRNAHVTTIDASRLGFDDADAIRIAEALRCDNLDLCDLSQPHYIESICAPEKKSLGDA